MDDEDVPRAYRGLHRFEWYLVNPLLPDGKVEAIFSFRHPFLTKWKARLERAQGMRTLHNLPVVLSLEYFPVPEDNGNGIRANLSVNISNLDEAGGAPRLMEPYSFVHENSHTCRIVSSIRPDNFVIAIIVYLSIGNRGGYRGEDQEGINYEVLEMDLDSLSEDMMELLSRPLHFDLLLQSINPSVLPYRVHSCILDVRWPDLVEKLGVQPDENSPPTPVADITPNVLTDILVYLYTGHIAHFNWFPPNNPPDRDYKTELFRAMDMYPLHHLHMLLQPELRVHQRSTRFSIYRTTADFEINARSISPTYSCQHILFEDISVIMSLTILIPRYGAPSFWYWLKFTNPIEIDVRVNLLYVRQVGLERETETLAYEQYWEVPDNGEVGPTPDIPIPEDIEHLNEFIAGGDRVERGHRVRHSLRLVLCASAGIDSLVIIRANDLQYGTESQKYESDEVFYHHMSVMQNRMQDTANLHVSVVDAVTRNLTETHRLHKPIFAIRVPYWRNVIQEIVPFGEKLPDNVTCTTRNGVFQVVTNYLYTGRYRDIPLDLIDAVSHFAEESGFTSLINKIPLLFEARRPRAMED